MDSGLMMGVSLTASFLAGVLALFAPCCITFLFPSYMATIFKNEKKVMLYTLLFALGLSFILIPVALGFRFFIFFLDEYHKQVYYLGALVMILMGIMTLKPIFHIPQIFHFNPRLDKNINAGSVFGLGLMSGLTSACCAPVLFAAITLTTLSPSLFQAAIVSLAYVLGIVFPLFIMSLFYKKATNKLSGKNRQKVYTVLKFLGGGIFLISGVLIAIFNYFGKIEMNQMEGYSKTIRLLVFDIATFFDNPWFDTAIFSVILFTFYLLLKKGTVQYDRTYTVSGMKCQSCVKSLTKALKNMKGVQAVHVNFSDSIVSLQTDRSFNESEVLTSLSSDGYELQARKEVS